MLSENEKNAEIVKDLKRYIEFIKKHKKTIRVEWIIEELTALADNLLIITE